ncbi:MAG: ABC transporter substrate-binding protein [Bacteroidota bacterium]
MLKPLFYKILILLGLFLVLGNCAERSKTKKSVQTATPVNLNYAEGFSISKEGAITVLKVFTPWPKAAKTYAYALVPRTHIDTINLSKVKYDAIVPTPVRSIIVTSTTHVPALEALGQLEALVGFPGLDLISSKAARQQIAKGKLQELGTNMDLNIEMVLSTAPDLVMGFGIDGNNKAYETLQNSGIPVVYNGDWTEYTPLGKAEWIKFFAPFFQKEQEADRIFDTVVQSYMNVKKMAQKASDSPTVLTGGLYKDVWYVAGGQSWMSQFLKDANTNYLWSDTDEVGSIGLSVETVLEKGQSADIWLNPSQHTSYKGLQAANPTYEEFKAFTNQKVYSNAMKKGPTGGLLFFELAPYRPDLVLEDLIAIMHPELLPTHQPHFFMPLD